MLDQGGRSFNYLRFLIFGQIAAFGVQVLCYRVLPGFVGLPEHGRGFFPTSVYEAVRTPLLDRVGDRSQ